MLEISNLSKRYGKVLANDHINLALPEHSIGLLVGPNGAGKSTLIKCIMGLLRYEGTIRLNGLDTHSVEAKKQLGYVPEIPQIYGLLTVREHLEFIARAHKLGPDWKARGDELLRRFELTDKASKLGGALSKGMQQKVSLCTALLPEPAFILFDEPLIGLDPHGIKELKLLFGELAAKGQSMLISTHILDTVEELWTDVNIMMNGRIVVQKRADELAASGQSLEDLFFAVTEAPADTTAADETTQGPETTAPRPVETAQGPGTTQRPDDRTQGPEV